MEKHRKFHVYLQEVFSERQRANPQYSLRGFALDLGVNDSTLSQILKGVRPITEYRIKSLGRRLNLTPKQILGFVQSHSNDNSTLGFKQLELDTFNVMADWYFDAILELSKLDGFNPDPKWIAKVLGLNISKVRQAIQTLKRLGVIDIDCEGAWTNNLENSLVNFDTKDFTSNALKEYQRQLLELSKQAVDNTPKVKRNHTSFILALDSNLVSEIHSRIQAFQKELADLVENHSHKKDEVYTLQFSSFPLTNQNKG